MAVSQATAGGQGAEQPGSGAGQVQGTPDASQGQDGFWGLFPNVPVEQRDALEPHLKNVQAYVTRLQMDHAPYKEFSDAGLTPEDIKATVSFGQRFQQDPVGTVFQLLESMQQSGQLHQELDLDAVRAAAEGREDPTAGGDIVEPGQQQTGEMPPWAIELQQQMDQMGQFLQAQHATQQKAVQDATLNKTLERARTELQAANVDLEAMYPDNPEDAEKYLVAALITNQMDVAKAVGQITAFRDAATKGLMEETTTTQDRELELPNGAPQARPQPTGGRQDGFSRARSGAQAMLERNLSATAQGS